MSARPTILHLVKGLGIGGAERLISEGSRHWDQDAFRYHVAYVLPWKDQLVAEIRDNGVPVTCIGGRRGYGPPAALRLRRLVHSTGTDLVHVHSPGVAPWARVLAGAPVVYTEHNVVDSYHPLTKWANGATYGRNTVSVAVSDAVADSVMAIGLPRPRVIRNGVSCTVTAAQRRAARAELGLDEGQPLVVHVGNIRPGKGHDNLVATARRALADRAETTFVSIGVEKHPGTLDRLRRDAADLGDRVRFLGRRADAWAFIAAADVFVNPSEVEGLPVAVLEAMCLGTPVAATSVGGVPDVVIDGDTGLLVDPGDPAALAAAVNGLLRDEDLGRRLAKGAAQLVTEHYDIGPMVRAYEDVYHEVLGG